MDIKTNLIDCHGCGVYLNSERVEKTILTFGYKERFCGDRNTKRYIYIVGFYCPICKKLHIKEDFCKHDIKYAIEDDEEVNNTLSVEEYIIKKLAITERYYSIEYYGEELE